MLKSISLQNFKSFGERQTVPLEPISVLVGPNNSGKSSFLSVGSFFRQLASGPGLSPASSDAFVFHKPPSGNGAMAIEWESEAGRYYGSHQRPEGRSPGVVEERFQPAGTVAWRKSEDILPPLGHQFDPVYPFQTLQVMTIPGFRRPPDLWPIVAPIVGSRDVKISLTSVRADSLFGPDARLREDGSHLATVINVWRSAYPERAEQLEAILRTYLPEIRRVLASPAPASGATNGNGEAMVRLWFEQTDGERFDAMHVSDGVLFFTALAAQVIDAEERALIFIEEPEQSIHPRRLHDLVELLRDVGAKRGCQFIIATHSPVLLDEFRDEPEAILLFRRSEQGTVVRPLAEVETLRDALEKTRPGEMLASGFFNEPL